MSDNYKLSDHFTLYEFTKSQTATRNGIANAPTDEHIANLVILCNYILEPIRLHYSKPITISSGYRSVELNKRIGGSSTSDHCYGKAADIQIKGVDNQELFLWCKDNLKFKQLILEFYNKDKPEDSWVHISLDTTCPKQEVLRADRNSSGKTVYTRVG